MLIPYARQDISPEDIEAVVGVLRGDWLTQGPAIEQFENAVATAVGAVHAVAVSSGTAALHLACLALDVGPGDLVWTSPNTFVASANCARYCGADVDFVDIDPGTLNLSVAALEAKLHLAQKRGRLPKLLVAVHFGGLPCDMAAIAELARKYQFRVVEDASHAIGARYHTERTGTCRYSDITVFSLHPVKIITAGEGGLLTTSDPEVALRLRTLRTHGVVRDPNRMTRPSEGPWYYEQIELGYNYRITDIQAALGLSQLSRLDQFIAKRSTIAARYQRQLRDLPVEMQKTPANVASAWHLFVVQVDPSRTTRARREVFEAMRAHGVLVNVHYIPVHLQPYYRELGFRPGDFPNAEAYYSKALSLPMYFGLSESEQDVVVDCLARAAR